MLYSSDAVSSTVEWSRLSVLSTIGQLKHHWCMIECGSGVSVGCDCDLVSLQQLATSSTESIYPNQKTEQECGGECRCGG